MADDISTGYSKVVSEGRYEPFWPGQVPAAQRLKNLTLGLAWDEGVSRLLGFKDSTPKKDGAERVWRLRNLDDKTVVEGQFRPEDLRFRNAQRVDSAFPQNSDVPVQNYVSGTVDTLNFTGTFWAEHGNDFSVRQRLDALQRLVKKDQKLYRPPICLFAVGVDVAFLCLVESVDVEILDLRDDGTFRGARVSLSLVRYDPIDQDLAAEAVRKPPKTRVVREGENWELIGYLEYGFAAAGRMLEEFNLAWAQTADGRPLLAADEIELPPVDNLKSEPLSLSLGGAEAALSFGAELLLRR